MTYPKSDPRWRPHQNGHKKHSGPHKSMFEQARFCAWDGEGITLESGEHIYTLLMNSDGAYIENWETGLSTAQCLEFIVSEARAMNRDTIHVMFGGSYDANMMVRDLSRKDVQRLQDGQRTQWHGYMLTYRQRKELSIQRLRPRKLRTVTLWDVFGFFQASFVDALTEWLGDSTEQVVLDAIADMKKQRHIFSADSRTLIVQYCAKEVQLLKALMERLAYLLGQAGLPVSRWDGAGAIATSAFRRAKLKERIVYDTDMEGVARYGYAGGRIEAIRYGITRQPVWVYDINSAYPAALVTIPPMVGGSWESCNGMHSGPIDPFGFYHIRWSYPQDLSVPYPFFFRLQSDSIRFPASGEGVVRGVELQAAFDTRPGGVGVVQSWRFRPGDGESPFAFVRDVYQTRQRWKAEGNPAQKVLKLGINSMYGKLAQQVGWNTRNGKPPTFHNMVCAGYVTAYVRASIYRAAMLQPEGVIFMATDGICSTAQLPLHGNGELGSWSVAEYGGVCCVQSGVYWYFNHFGKTVVSHYRGYDRGQLNPYEVEHAWLVGREYLEAPCTRFVTMGAALAGDGQWAKWRRWETLIRRLDLRLTGKRLDVTNWLRDGNPANGLVPTIATPVPRGTISEPYPIPWLANRPLHPSVEGMTDERFIAEVEDSWL